jgi:hypothetical protein
VNGNPQKLDNERGTAMKTTDPEVLLDVQRAKPLRQARLQALIFTGGAFGTMALTLGATWDPKLPPFVGE